MDNFWTNSSAVPANCKNDDNQLFVQYTCVHDPELMWYRYRAVTFIGSVAVFMALVFSIWVRYADNDTNI
jgi:hypothetical protein